MTTKIKINLQGLADCIPLQDPLQAIVTKIVDGDTIYVDINGQEYSLRYIGIDAPESTNKLNYFANNLIFMHNMNLIIIYNASA